MTKARNPFTLTFVHDPLCGWCFAIQPQLEQLMKQWGDQLTLKSVVAGLFVGDDAPVMGDGMFKHLQKGLPEVEAVSSVRFGEAFKRLILEDPSYVYETGQACRAVVAAELICPERILHYIHKLQDAFFVEGMDARSTETFAEVAAKVLPVSRSEFQKVFLSDVCQTECAQQFTESRSLLAGVRRTTMPALLLTCENSSESILLDHENNRSSLKFMTHVGEVLRALSKG